MPSFPDDPATGIARASQLLELSSPGPGDVSDRRARLAPRPGGSGAGMGRGGLLVGRTRVLLSLRVPDRALPHATSRGSISLEPLPAHPARLLRGAGRGRAGPCTALDLRRRHLARIRCGRLHGFQPRPAADRVDHRRDRRRSGMERLALDPVVRVRRLHRGGRAPVRGGRTSSPRDDHRRALCRRRARGVVDLRSERDHERGPPRARQARDVLPRRHDAVLPVWPYPGRRSARARRGCLRDGAAVPALDARRGRPTARVRPPVGRRDHPSTLGAASRRVVRDLHLCVPRPGHARVVRAGSAGRGPHRPGHRTHHAPGMGLLAARGRWAPVGPGGARRRQDGSRSAQAWDQAPSGSVPSGRPLRRSTSCRSTRCRRIWGTHVRRFPAPARRGCRSC